MQRQYRHSGLFVGIDLAKTDSAKPAFVQLIDELLAESLAASCIVDTRTVPG